MQKGSKDLADAKSKNREALDRATFGGDATAFPLRDGTVGHEESAPGTWNTSGVEMPQNAGLIRDVRPETSTAVSTENLKELGVPVRDASDYVAGIPVAPVVAEPETQDRTLEIKAAADANPDAVGNGSQSPNSNDEYESMNVEELKAELDKRDLPVSGNKGELIARLRS